MFEKFRLTLTGAASHSFGRKTYVRDKPVTSDDPDEVAWAMKTGRFKVEPVEEAPAVPVDPEPAPADPGPAPVEPDPGQAPELADPEAAPEAQPDPPATEPEPPAPDGRTWSDDALRALLAESIKTIGPKLTEMTVADLERLRELEEAEPDTRKTLLTEIDQELDKKR